MRRISGKVGLLLCLVASPIPSRTSAILGPNPVAHSIGWRRRRRRKAPTPTDPDVLQVKSTSSTTTSNHHFLSSSKAKQLAFRYFLGSTPQTTIIKPSSTQTSQSSRRIGNVRQALTSALDELEALRKELEALRQLVRPDADPEIVDSDGNARYKKMAAAVEVWADRMLSDDETDDSTSIEWKDIRCTKMLRGRYNADERTETSLTWMVDSREQKEDDDSSSTTLWPCLRIRSTIDAPLCEVSAYLAQAEHANNYNALLSNHRRIATVGPQAQITMAQTPQILFVQPRTFVTFCAYRWRRRGRELVIVNQALDTYTPPDDTETIQATAFCFRGATVLKEDENDPSKTHIALLAHASPGPDVPSWACRTATHTLAAMEPFQLFYKLNQEVTNAVQQRKKEERAVMNVAEAAVDVAGAAAFQDDVAPTGDNNNRTVKTIAMEKAMVDPNEKNDTNNPSQTRTSIIMDVSPSAQPLPESKRPVGIAHMGYACFWPNGAEDGDNRSSEEEGKKEE